MKEPEKPEAIEALDRVLGDLDDAAGADGKISVRDAYLLMDKWQSSITYGGVPVLELGEAVEMPSDLLRRETDSFRIHNRTNAVPWGLIAVGAVTAALYYWLGRSHFLTGLGFSVCAALVIQLGVRAGRQEGYWDGLQRGYGLAVMHKLGIVGEDAEREFWDTHRQTETDRHIADLLRQKES